MRKTANCCFDHLRDREVVNTCDGRRLGYVVDLEIDLCCGKILALFVPGEFRCLTIGRGKCIRIPWECIERIGDDIILVNVHSLPPFDGGKEKKHSGRSKGRVFFGG